MSITIQASSMANQYREIFCSALLGTAIGALGVFLMGYIAAVAIPKEFILWFGNNELALLVINTISQFLAFGVTALIAGSILGRLSKLWLLNSLVCYLAFLFYLTAGVSLVYGGEISNPFPDFTFYHLPSLLLLPACLFASTYLSAKKL
jgi:hypothetical protein